MLVIDVQGARQVRDRAAEAVAIFVLPPSFDVLSARLRGRNQDSEAAILRRLATATREVEAVETYDYVVVNDDLARCVDRGGRHHDGRARAPGPAPGGHRLDPGVVPGVTGDAADECDVGLEGAS